MLIDESSTEKLSKAASAVGSKTEFKSDGVYLINEDESDQDWKGSVFAPHYD